ncbi:related to gibberellin 20-oxidase [Phialocephala subalpina]|uniref:Related to gibberellin 20-oxidase n=1 Tax=Phialocephala subalpina TaxID=576137 RepID=A0A1L7WX15_9HELO|nr:related to gibberellin 20-oxidase [Phialocephala subalpina]
MAPQTSAVNSDNLFIPLVDFSHFLNGTPAQRQSTAQSILHGFQTAGFIYLTHIPISSCTIQKTFTTSAKFFNRPQEQKDALGWTTPEANRGYVAHGREKVSVLKNKEDVEKAKAAAPDLKESIEIGREGAKGLPNNWPSGDDEAVEFKKVMLDFHDQCKELHVEVMRAIAVGMELSESYFDNFTDVGDNTLRLLHYPEVKKDVFKNNNLQVRAGEHTDYGSITLLFQDMRGGLQVKSPNGNFIDATPIEGSVVVNAGDLLARWSNDTIKSTLHRVVEPPAPEEGDVHPARYSIAYFCNPNFESKIEAIEGTYGGEKGARKYEDILSGEYLVQRLAATY